MRFDQFATERAIDLQVIYSDRSAGRELGIHFIHFLFKQGYEDERLLKNQTPRQTLKVLELLLSQKQLFLVILRDFCEWEKRCLTNI